MKKQVISHVTMFNISRRDLQFQYFHVIVQIPSGVHEVAVCPLDTTRWIEEELRTILPRPTRWIEEELRTILPRPTRYV